jgi:hypothetical protein
VGHQLIDLVDVPIGQLLHFPFPHLFGQSPQIAAATIGGR